MILELGGNAACVVDETWDDIEDAISRVIIERGHGGSLEVASRVGEGSTFHFELERIPSPEAAEVSG